MNMLYVSTMKIHSSKETFRCDTNKNVSVST